MARKLTKSDIREILASRFADDECKKLSDIPMPHSFKDIDKAAKRIKKAIDKKEKIAIVGDYDVDGVVSLVILSTFFDDLKVEYDLVIPNRFLDGYGINLDIIKRLDCDVIITVGDGISAIDQTI